MPPSHHHSHAHAARTPQQQQQQQQQQIPSYVPVSRLGLSQQDAAALQQHQQLAHAQIRSPSGSQASSQGRLLLDPTSLTLLGRHFDNVMRAIQQRLEQLNEATERAATQQFDRAGNAIEMADAEIARFRAILRQIDELELEFDKIRRIREISVKNRTKKDTKYRIKSKKLLKKKKEKKKNSISISEKKKNSISISEKKTKDTTRKNRAHEWKTKDKNIGR